MSSTIETKYLVIFIKTDISITQKCLQMFYFSFQSMSLSMKNSLCLNNFSFLNVYANTFVSVDCQRDNTTAPSWVSKSS